MKPKHIYLFKRLLYFIHGEKFYKRLPYDWKMYPSRTEIIKKIISYKKYKTYLEIGCDLDENFLKIDLKDKIGVDPKSGGTHRMTSDEFFSNNRKMFDVVYIDGYHFGPQVYKDCENAWKCLKENGFLICDDYTWNFYSNIKNNPCYAINNFLKKIDGQYKLEKVSNSQIFIKKIVKN